MGQPSARSSQRRRRQPAPSGRRLPLRPALLGRQGLEHLPVSRLGASHPCHHHRRRPNQAPCHPSQGCHRRPPGRRSQALGHRHKLDRRLLARRPNQAPCHPSRACQQRPLDRRSQALERCRSRALARQRSQPLGRLHSRSNGNPSPRLALARRLRCRRRASLSRLRPHQGLVERLQDLAGYRSRALAHRPQVLGRHPKNVLA